jgi:hypothetical protein
MSIINFLKKNKGIIKAVSQTKRVLITAFHHIVVSTAQILDGSWHLIPPILLGITCYLLVKDINDARLELQLKKELNAKMYSLIRPLVFIFFSFCTLRIATRDVPMSLNKHGGMVHRKQPTYIFTPSSYTLTVVRLLYSKAMQIAEARDLKNDAFLLHQKTMFHQRQLYYMIRVLRSCLIIQNWYIHKSFYLARENSKIADSKQVNIHPNETTMILLERVKKPVGVPSKSQIQTCKFFQILLEHVKIIEKSDEQVNWAKANSSKMLLELLRKDREELNTEIYHLPGIKPDHPNLSYSLISDKGSEGNASEEE